MLRGRHLKMRAVWVRDAKLREAAELDLWCSAARCRPAITCTQHGLLVRAQHITTELQWG